MHIGGSHSWRQSPGQDVAGEVIQNRAQVVPAPANHFELREIVITSYSIHYTKLYDTCEHHFVTIDGVAKVAYIPKDRIIGLSKINRIVRFFAQRPQVQERLTRQILVALQVLLGTEDVAVSIDATHYCVKS